MEDPTTKSIRSPLDIVQQLTAAADLNAAVKAHFDQVASSARGKIPDLNTVPVQRVPSGTLVRFRCMVQNMMGPEYYCKRYTARRRVCGPNPAVANFEEKEMIAAYRDFVDESDSSWEIRADESSMAEREVLVCVPPPGEAAWMTQINASAAEQAPATPGSHKRSLEEDSGEADDETMAPPRTPSAAPRAVRARPDSAASGAVGASGNVADQVSKFFHPYKNSAASACCRAVVVKTSDGTAFKIGELVEFVGVLETGAGYNEASATPGDVSLPASMLPRLHVVTHRPLGYDFPPVETRLPADAAAVARASLVDCLRGATGGDTLAAEYALLQMVSGANKRVGRELVGSVSVNLMTGTTTPKGAVGTAVSAVAERVLPRSMRCPLSIQALNTTPFVPRADKETQQLQAGFLQMADRTLLVVDETVMEEGKLLEPGLLSLQGLKQLISTQQVAYEFNAFSTINFDTDVMPVVVSQGKSLLECNVLVRVQPTAAPAVPSLDDPALQERLMRWRQLAAQAHSSEVSMSPEVSKVIEDDYVAARKADTTVGEQTLHLWISLARLVAASHGATRLEPAHWQQVRALESERVRRLAL